MSFFINLIKQLVHRRRFLWDLSLKDFRSSYSGSAFGRLWSIFEPLTYMLILWVFFTKALKIPLNNDQPYMPWLMSSMILWYFLNAAITHSIGLFRNYSYLLKQPQFEMATLPIVSVISAFFNHLIFLVLLILALLSSGKEFDIHWLQFLYFLFCSTVFIFALAWSISSINLFFKDIKNVVVIGLQFGFWVSPIFWETSQFPERFQPLIKLNPFYYLLTGYRNSFIYNRPISDLAFEGLTFWGITILLLIFGAYIYKKLRPQFGDVAT